MTLSPAKRTTTIALFNKIKHLWGQKLSGREIADQLSLQGYDLAGPDVLAIVTRSRHREHFPPKTPAEHKAAQSRGLKKFWNGKEDRSPIKKRDPRPPTVWKPGLTARAAELWARSLTAKEIAEALSSPDFPITHKQVQNITCSRRDLFPPRYKAH